MAKLRSKLGVSIVLLIGAFVFGYAAISGVFGSTQLGLTLRTNTDLQRGLVGHWTFDSTDVNGYTVSDSSGNGNHGGTIATTSVSGTEVTIDGVGSSFDMQANAPQIAWVSSSTGYAFYPDNGNNLNAASTTDGGATWNVVDGWYDYSSSIYESAIWYEGWNPENTGTKIHIGIITAADEGPHYIEYDTEDDSYTVVGEVVPAENGFRLATAGFAITRGADGRLYMTYQGSNPFIVSCRSVCTSASSWEALPDYIIENSSSRPVVMVPVGFSDDVMHIYYENDGSTLDMHIYDTSADLWLATTTIVSGVPFDNLSRDGKVSAVTHPNTGKTYLSYLDDVNEFTTEDHDIDFWEYDPSIGSWSELTAPVTNASGGLVKMVIGVDSNFDDHIYLVYARRETIGTASSENLYWRKSEDGGTTWSAEQGRINDTDQETFSGLSLGYASPYKMGIFHKYVGGVPDNDVTYEDIFDISDTYVDKPAVGNIGQGMSFDGFDDFVEISDSADLSGGAAVDRSWSLWLKPHTVPTQSRGAFVMSKILSATQKDWSLKFLTTGSAGFYYENGDGNDEPCGSTTNPECSTLETYDLNEWGHFGVTFDGSTRLLTLYKDGEFSTSTTLSFDLPDTAANVQIGRTPSYDNNFFDGELDDVRAYTRTLSAEEMRRLYQLGATTKVNKTLDTNTGLSDGLVAHWSFDTTSVSGARIADQSSNGNDLYTQATTTEAEVQVGSSTIEPSAIQHYQSVPLVVVLEPTDSTTQNGYIFYQGPDQELLVASTTDGGGSTWTGSTTIDAQTDVVNKAVWYDRWTNGNTDTNIHVATIDSGADSIFYTEFDTSDGSISTPVDVMNGVSLDVQLAPTNFPSIVRAENGTLLVAVDESEGNIIAYCEASCTTASNWATTSSPFGSTDDQDYNVMLPLHNTDNIVIVYHDLLADELRYNVWSATSSTWWGSNSIVSDIEHESSVAYSAKLSATYQKGSGDIYVAIGDDINNFSVADHDIDVWHFDHQTFTWTEKTKVIEDDSGGITAVRIIVDNVRDDVLYAVYSKRSTISDANSERIYYKVSTDAGDTWGNEIQLTSTVDDLTSLYAPLAVEGDSSIIVGTKYTTGVNQDELWTARIGVGDFGQEKFAQGTMGQGYESDGLNDVLVAADSASFDNIDTLDTMSVAAWVYYEDNGDNFNLIFAKGPYNDIYSMYTRTETVAPADLCVYVASVDQCPTDAQDILEEDEWYHVGWSYDGSSVDVHINGVEVQSIPASGSIGQSANSVYLGASDIGSDYWQGKMDDVRVYDRAISSEEFKRLYELGATTKINKTLDSNPDLQRGLTAHWTFDGWPATDVSSTSAEVRDISGSALHGDMTNYTDVADGFVPGILGQAIELDGTNDYIALEDQAYIASSTPFTLAFWTYLDEFIGAGSNDFPTVIQLQTDLTEPFLVFFEDEGVFDGLNFGASNGITEFIELDSGPDAPASSFLGRWRHVVITYDAVDHTAQSSFRLYIDSVEEDTTAAPNFSNSANNSRIGEMEGSSSSHFDGKLDDIRIYNRELSQEEIRRLYQLGGQ